MLIGALAFPLAAMVLSHVLPRVTTFGRVREGQAEGTATRVHCEVWVEKDDGTRIALGSASAVRS